MLVPLHDIVVDYNLSINGVLHVGAHRCEENSLYLDEGVAQTEIFWVEANPDIVKTLTLPNVIEAAVSDTVENVVFNITNNGQSSSILPLKDHRIVHPDVYVTATRVVKTQLLENIMKDHNIKANFINLDNHGA